MDADPVAAMSYEQARDELVAIVNQLETGTPTLEASLALWERGEALAARCQQWLDGARARLAQARDTTETPPGADDVDDADDADDADESAGAAT